MSTFVRVVAFIVIAAVIGQLVVSVCLVASS